jgi:hypothetical protein
VSRAAELAEGARTGAWCEPAVQTPALSVHVIASIVERAEASAADGLLPGLLTYEQTAGLTPASPLSTSKVATLLSCPHRYLHENVLGLRDAERPLPAHALALPVFDAWLHAVAEEYWREYQSEIAAREGALDDHRIRLHALLARWFSELAPSYPFADAAAQERARDALARQLDALLCFEWRQPPRRYLAIARSFGEEENCALETPAGVLHVRGSIDFLYDSEAELGARTFESAARSTIEATGRPALSRDLRLGIHSQVVAQSRVRSGKSVRASTLSLGRVQREYSWEPSRRGELAQATSEWLATAVETLSRGAFVSTGLGDDCAACSRRALCESGHARSRRVLADPRVPRRLALLKGEP